MYISPRVCSRVLSRVCALLNSYGLLSLRTDGDDTPADFMTTHAFAQLCALLYRLAGNPDRTAGALVQPSEASAATTTSWLIVDSEEPPTLPKQLRAQALSTLVRLTIAQGHLANALAATELLLYDLADAKLDVRRSLQSLSINRADQRLPLPTVRKHQMQWHVGDIRSCTHVATASDGTFLYVHCNQGLFKIGTGDGASAPGVVYGHVDFANKAIASMACAHGMLYIHLHNDPHNITAHVLDCAGLYEVGTLYRDGSGTVASRDLTKLGSGTRIVGREPTTMLATFLPWNLSHGAVPKLANTVGVATAGSAALVIPPQYLNLFPNLYCPNCGIQVAQSLQQRGAGASDCYSCRQRFSWRMCTCGMQQNSNSGNSNYCNSCGRSGSMTNVEQYYRQWYREDPQRAVNRGRTTKKGTKSTTAKQGAGLGGPGVRSFVRVFAAGSGVLAVMGQDGSIVAAEYAKDAKARKHNAYVTANARRARQKGLTAVPLNPTPALKRHSLPVHVDLLSPAEELRPLHSLTLRRRVGRSNVVLKPHNNPDDATSGSDGSAFGSGKKQKKTKIASFSASGSGGGGIQEGCVGAYTTNDFVTDMTVECRVRLDANVAPSSTHVFLSRYNTSNQAEIMIYYQSSTLYLNVSVNGVATTASKRIADGSLSKWTHLAAVVDSEINRVTLFVNGEPLASAACTRKFTTGTLFQHHMWVLGASYSSQAQNIVRGAIADVRVWGRALTQEDIQEGNRRTQAPEWKREADLLACWPMDEGLGSVIVDRSSAGQNGFVIGNCAWVEEQRPGPELVTSELVVDTVMPGALAEATVYSNGESLMVYFPPDAARVEACPAQAKWAFTSSNALYRVYSLQTGELELEQLVSPSTCALGSAVSPGRAGTLWALAFTADSAAVARKLALARPLRMPEWVKR